MKIIKTYSSEHIINDSEVKIIVENSNSDKLLLLDSGEYVKAKSVIAIVEPETEAFWGGYPLSKDGKSFMRDGQRIYLEQQNFKEIEYRTHSKYKIKSNKLLN